MKRFVDNYVFNKTAKTVSSFEFTSLERILSIVNSTTGDVIYSPVEPTKGGTLSNYVLTLDYDTSAMSDTDKLQIILSAPTTNFKWSFARNVVNGVDTNFGQLLQTGSGMTVNQTGGNLVVTTGVTAFSETIIRSNLPISGAFFARYSMQLSQRISNQNFAIELIDIVGDGLAMTINSATSVTVTIPNNTFTTANDAGKGIWIGRSSVASVPTQRATIASVAGDNVTLTVTGFPATGTGTCSLFGLNYHQVIYSGTSATTLGPGYSTQRLGLQRTSNGTINSSSTGHIGVIDNPRCIDSTFADQIITTGTNVQITQRATNNDSVPDEHIQLYWQIRVWNGSTAPATTTTMTMGFIDAQLVDPLVVSIGGIQPMGAKNVLGVSVQGTPQVQGSGAHDASAGGFPLQTGGRANNVRPAAVSADNDVVYTWQDRHGATIIENAGPRGLKSNPITTTITSSVAETTIAAAGGAGVFLDLHSLVVMNNSTTPTVVTIRSATAGSAVFTISLAGGEKWGIAKNGSDAIKQAVANNNWTAQCSVSVASVVVTVETISKV